MERELQSLGSPKNHERSSALLIREDDLEEPLRLQEEAKRLQQRSFSLKPKSAV